MEGYCIGCGTKISFWGKGGTICKECNSDICYEHINTFSQFNINEYDSFCLFCMIKKLEAIIKKLEKEKSKVMSIRLCPNCDNKSPIKSVYCSYCGALLRKDKITLLRNKK